MERFIRLLLCNEISQNAIIASNISYGAGITGNDHAKNISASTDITSLRGSLLRWRYLLLL
jgi:hypothetical protein